MYINNEGLIKGYTFSWITELIHTYIDIKNLREKDR